MQLKPTIQQVVAVMKAFNGIRRKTAIFFLKGGVLVVCTHRKSAPALVIDCNLP